MILESFYYMTDRVSKHIPNCEKFMMDSGAFTFIERKKSIDNLDDYIKQYCDFINNYKIDLFFEMDIDDIIGYREVLKLRNRIEQLTNKQPIPVYHFDRSVSDFEKECIDYKYVAYGGIAKTRSVDHEQLNQFIEIAHSHNTNIHCLGYTNMKGLTQHKFDSVDSSSWSMTTAFGRVVEFDETNLIHRLQKPNNCRLISKVGSKWNFREWVKFQKYAKYYL